MHDVHFAHPVPRPHTHTPTPTPTHTHTHYTHRIRPHQYKKNMPDIESLMQEWPEEFEEMLQKTTLPGPDMELSLEEYAKVSVHVLLRVCTHEYRLLYSQPC